MPDSPRPSPNHPEHDSSDQLVELNAQTNNVPSTFQLSPPPPPRRSGQKGSDSPHPSPNHLEHDPDRSQPNQQTRNGVINNVSSAVHLPTPPRLSSRQESLENLKSFKVSLEDPAWKVLPAALRKYKINNDDWQNYAMFICYGPSSTSR